MNHMINDDDQTKYLIWCVKCHRISINEKKKKIVFPLAAEVCCAHNLIEACRVLSFV